MSANYNDDDDDDDDEIKFPKSKSTSGTVFLHYTVISLTGPGNA